MPPKPTTPMMTVSHTCEFLKALNSVEISVEGISVMCGMRKNSSVAVVAPKRTTST